MSAADRPASDPGGGIIGSIETILLCALLLGIVFLGFAQILLRELFLTSWFWADELIRLAVLWLAMIGAMVASREGRHIAIGIVPRYCPRSWHRPAGMFSMLFASAIAGILAWQTFRFVADERLFGETVLGDQPAWLFQSIMPLGFAVIAWRFLRHAIAIIRDQR